jgi:DNA-binding NarL/FixJ family response regulator
MDGVSKALISAALLWALPTAALASGPSPAATLKSSTGDDLVLAIRAVASGGRWIPSDIASRLAVRKEYEERTAREIEVLREIEKGHANKGIAAALLISENTVKDHLKNILGKLQVAARTEAVTAALPRGIIEI